MTAGNAPTTDDAFAAKLESLMALSGDAAAEPARDPAAAEESGKLCPTPPGGPAGFGSGSGAFGLAPTESESEIDDAPPSAAEKRSSVRHPYLHHVQVAGLADGDGPPSADQFQEVLCEDLSTGGAAVFLKDPPDSELLIVGLGEPPNRTYLLARVAHVEPVFRIGCQFLRRLQLDPDTGEWIGLPGDNRTGEMSVPSEEGNAR